MNTVKILGSAKLIAHRGVSGLETENSIPAFIAAGNRSYYGIETDIHVTKDGRFVAIHDEFTGRVAWEDINVEASDYSQVRQVRLRDLHPVQAGEEQGAISEKRQDLVIPSLEEYVNICKKYEKVCVMELKNEFQTEDIRRLVEEIRGLGYLEHVDFISFSLNNMRTLRALLPKQNLYYLCCEYNGEILKTLKQYGLYLDIYYEALTKEIVDELHEEAIRVNCWTCDEKKRGQELAEWGVDFITSNILE